ncbi:MAG: hypothetical protein M3255_03755 [Pseudomonadota bacterium]|nr:hypothetical protein [Pseudomonadota bacterium]
MAVAFIYEQDADEELMLKACDGDEKAFNVLYARHKNRLYRYVRYQCGDPTTVHDIFQEVWENLFKACKRYTVQAKFITYLFKVAHNRVMIITAGCPADCQSLITPMKKILPIWEIYRILSN